MRKIKEIFQDKKELIKKGSVFPALSYLATGYIVSFFVSTFFWAFLAASELGLVGATEYSQAIWGGERVVAFAVVALVLAGAIFDLISKKISKKQGIITIIISFVFFILVALSSMVFQGLL